MPIVAHEEQKKALDVAKELKLRIDFEMNRLQGQLDELELKQEATDAFISMLEEDLGVEESPSVGDVARDIARNNPGLLVTSKEVTEAVTLNGIGTENAVHAFFSRTTDFERVGRGQYRMRSKDGEGGANDSTGAHEQEHSQDATEP